MAKVVGIRTYLVKSTRGEWHDMGLITPTGFAGDREFMVVDARMRHFVTQRPDSVPRLARCEPRVVLDGGKERLVINMHDDLGPKIFHGRPKADWWRGEPVTVTTWDHEEVPGVDQGDEVAAALSGFLERDVRLVFMREWMRPSRAQTPGYDTVYTSFADDFPFLLTSLASLEDLARHHPHPVTMDAMRPNIVVDCGPWEEETWRRFRIGSVEFHGMKRCTRCPITGTNQMTGELTEPTPATTLRYRPQGKKGRLGVNLNHHGSGVIRMGMEVEVLEYGEPITGK